VELVGAENEQRRAGDDDACVEERAGRVRKQEQHQRQHGRRHDAVVAVGLDEVVAGDVFRIDVVKAERPHEVGAEDRRGLVTDGVARPVDDPGQDVRHDVARQRGEGDADPRASAVGGSRDAVSDPDERPECEGNAGDLERPMAAPVRGARWGSVFHAGPIL